MSITPRLIVTTRLRRAFLLLALGATVSLSACTTNSTTEGTTADSSPVSSVDAPAAVSTESSDPATEPGTASSASNVTQKVYADDGIAIGGADPVAYFTQEAFVPGSSEYTHDWQGVTWQFASAENRDQFASNPEEYAPQYGGHCAWAVAAKDALVAIDPNAWSVVDGKLYLNANKRVQSTWEKDIPGFIAQADSKWPALATQ